MFKLTPSAANQVREAAREGGMEGMALRLAATPKPDGTLDYKMGFDERNDTDVRVSSEGIEIIMAAEDQTLLDGTVMDFVELEPGDWRFIFLNPNDANCTPPQDDAAT